ncbi:MAG: serine hydrolase [Halioglobus sp.]
MLGALAQAIEDGDIAIDSTVRFTDAEIVPAGATINDVPLGTQVPLRDMSALMMGRSDNTATDHIHELVGREKIESVAKAYNNNEARGLVPFLSTNEQFQVLWGLSPEQADDYTKGSDSVQRDFLRSLIEPLGPVTSFTYNNEDSLRDSSWRASVLDVCKGIAGLRQFDNRSDAFSIVDTSFGAEAVLTTLRQKWDRVWFKGGSLANGRGNYVLTMAWLLESDDRGAHVVILMANNEDGSNIELGGMYSLASRIAQILDAAN